MRVTATGNEVSVLLLRPPAPIAMLVLGHGAGAGMRHATMEAIASQLGTAGVATLRYQFPYAECGRRRPDPRGVLIQTVRSAVSMARELAGELPLLAGGKSMGGRMTSLAAAERTLTGVRGIVFFGFPLHPAGRPSSERAAHLARVRVPMLFLQGTRDRLAENSLVQAVCRGLGRAELHQLDGADHSFHVLRSSGLSEIDILREASRVVARWTARLTTRGRS